MSSDNELYNKKKLPPDNTGKTYTRRKTDDIRPALFKLYYTDPKSDTFMVIRTSAMRAGYSREYSDNLSTKGNNPKWFQELMDDTGVRRARMLRNAESALESATLYDDTDNARAALKIKAASFVSERLGKDVYSTRQEVTGADGRKLFSDKERESVSVPLAELFKAAKDGS